MSQFKTASVVAFLLILLAFYNEMINNIDIKYVNFHSFSF